MRLRVCAICRNAGDFRCFEYEEIMREPRTWWHRILYFYVQRRKMVMKYMLRMRKFPIKVTIRLCAGDRGSVRDKRSSEAERVAKFRVQAEKYSAQNLKNSVWFAKVTLLYNNKWIKSDLCPGILSFLLRFSELSYVLIIYWRG